MDTIGNPLLWGAFAALVLAALLADLRLMRHGGPHKVTFREAAWWSAGWVALALLFNAWLWWWVSRTSGDALGQQVALEFLTGYLVEKSLAVDNIFVFLVLFTYFAVPEEQRQRVLVIGVIGAIVLRAIMIFAGALLLARFHWILYVFGAFLLLTGIKMLLAAGQAPDLERNPVLRWLTGHLPLTRNYRGGALWVGEGRRRRYTPLFIVIVMVGVTDLIFAVDSIPAIFAITDDPFIVLTSNVFAVLGLRAMFFLLAGMADRFHLLPYGLAIVLMLIGVKMLLADVYKIPVLWSLLAVAVVLAVTVVLSLRRPPKAPPGLQSPPPPPSAPHAPADP
ncbi:TerC family protein [Vulcaniibacterium gelatinicum]|uniref:TerC family protein n=1 Tax=Vulcaniibacterium gelatinicum TaxID=2598725 RepID=UPI0011CB7831|nr:TerC family protein [Vulcaniibacterium gelatinicum]